MLAWAFNSIQKQKLSCYALGALQRQRESWSLLLALIVLQMGVFYANTGIDVSVTGPICRKRLPAHVHLAAAAWHTCVSVPLRANAYLWHHCAPCAPVCKMCGFPCGQLRKNFALYCKRSAQGANRGQFSGTLAPHRKRNAKAASRDQLPRALAP